MSIMNLLAVSYKIIVMWWVISNLYSGWVLDRSNLWALLANAQNIFLGYCY